MQGLIFAYGGVCWHLYVFVLLLHLMIGDKIVAIFGLDNRNRGLACLHAVATIPQPSFCYPSDDLALCLEAVAPRHADSIRHCMLSCSTPLFWTTSNQSSACRKRQPRRWGK
jgi:hypothetical protein